MFDYTEFKSTYAYGTITDLSATSVALLLSAISMINHYSIWKDEQNDLSSEQWDEIQQVIDTAIGEVMSSLVGLIMPHAMATASIFKFLPCDGGVYNKDDYPLLYDALDSAFIISGTQFTVPDMRDKFLVGSGASYDIDDSGGSDSVALSLSEIPAHTHTYQQYTFGIDIESVGVPDPTGVGQPSIPQSTSSVGSGNAHENRPQYRSLPFVIVAG